MVTAKDWLWHPCPVGNNAVNLYILIESVNFFYKPGCQPLIYILAFLRFCSSTFTDVLCTVHEIFPANVLLSQRNVKTFGSGLSRSVHGLLQLLETIEIFKIFSFRMCLIFLKGGPARSLTSAKWSTHSRSRSEDDLTRTLRDNLSFQYCNPLILSF